MAQYSLPPWLQPADPASAYAQGIQIGSRIGSEKAHQQAEQAAIERQTQLQALEQAQRQAEFGLKQQAAARRYAAQAQFKTLLDQGMDPAKALLQVAPDLGVPLGAAAQLYKETQPSPLTVEERGGEKFLRTGINSWQHIPTPATSQPKLFHNSDGTVTKVNPDGTVTTLGEARPKPPKPTELDKADIANTKAKLKKATADLEAINISDPETMTTPGVAKNAPFRKLDKIKEWQAIQNTVDLLRAKLANMPKGGVKILKIRQKEGQPAQSDTSDDED